MSHHHHHNPISRRDFIKVAGTLAGGAALAACNRRTGPLELTAVPATANPPGAGAAATQAPPAQTLPGAQAGATADTILVNGSIRTMDANRTVVRALAVKDGNILALGDEAAIQALRGAETKVLDLQGRTVTPGLIDAHCHLSACGMLGTTYVDISWPAVKTIQEMQALVAGRVAQTPEGEWVLGAGWVTYDGRFPNKHDIDPVAPKHPVMLINQGGHLAAVNSLALEMAGVTAKTKDPGNGLFLREANNEPDGTIMNHPAMDVFRRLWPDDLMNYQDMEASILSPQARFASMGVTSFQDVYARDMDRMLAYFNLGKSHQMSLRGQVMNVLEYIQELDGRIPAIEAIRYEDDYMHFAGGKCQVDGAGEASYTHEPHNGIAWNLTIWKPEDLKQVVRAFHDAGYQMALHAFGDAAVDMALDSIEAAMNATPRSDPRHRIEHSVLNTERAIRRQKDLGVVISVQPQMIRAFGDGALRIWGEERLQKMVPTRTWLKNGIPLALSSDAPSMPWWEPQATLAASLLRLTMTNKPVSPDQAMTIDEAMYAHTMGGAYADFAEKKKGSLEAGKFADLAVWRDDPYSAKPADLLAMKIDLTMIGGKIVYQA
jgi:predicted amidohydrolase YtcJ